MYMVSSLSLSISSGSSTSNATGENIVLTSDVISWMCSDWFCIKAIDISHKSHKAPVLYPTIHHSEQKCVHSSQTQELHNRACLPGGQCWDYYPGALSYLSLTLFRTLGTSRWNLRGLQWKYTLIRRHFINLCIGHEWLLLPTEITVHS